MTGKEPNRPRLAGGIFIALGLLVGAIMGVIYHEPSIGMVAGLVIGGTIALAVWFFDQRKA